MAGGNTLKELHGGTPVSRPAIVFYTKLMPLSPGISQSASHPEIMDSSNPPISILFDPIMAAQPSRT